MSEEFENSTTQVEHEYGGSEIQVLEGLEAVRKRRACTSAPPASRDFITWCTRSWTTPSTRPGGLLHRHHGDHQPGNTITVTDNGRGIPVDIQPQTGRPALEVVFTVLHAGGKFGGGGYKVSGGLHGVGASVVNALSEWLEVQVHKNGEIYEMKFSRGKITQEMKVWVRPTTPAPPSPSSPTPDVRYPGVQLRHPPHPHAEEAFLNAGLRIQTVDLRPGQEREDDMCYEGGIREFVTFINRNKTPIHEDVIYMSGAGRTPWPRSPCSITTGTRRSWSPSPTTSTPPRAACTRRLPPGSHQHPQRLRPQDRRAEKRRQGLRR